jgi:hypothetical protein
MMDLDFYDVNTLLSLVDVALDKQPAKPRTEPGIRYRDHLRGLRRKLTEVASEMDKDE